MPKISVSIIVPCFNVAAWLARCLDSLIGQTLHNIEIICVDDKSTDNTLEILQEYAARDKRISVIALSKNSGVAFARNTGVENARGEYIGFVDPDDYVDLDFYEKLYSTAKQTGADIVKGNVLSTDMNINTTSTDWRISKIKRNIACFSTTFWSAIYKHTFLSDNNIEFPVGVITSQDSVFLTQVCLHTHNIKIVKDTFYNYFYQHVGSLDSSVLTHTKALSKYTAFSMNYDYIKNSGIIGKQLEYMIDNHVLSHIAYEINKDFEQERDRELFFKLLYNVYIEHGMRKYIMSRFNPKLFKFVKQNNYTAFRQYMQFGHRRVYLFGFIPFLLIESWGKRTFIKLFDVIPLLKFKG